MANVDNVTGFSFYKNLHMDGPAQTWECVVLSAGAAVFVGDAVKLNGTGDLQGRPDVIIAAATNTNIFGVINHIQASGPDALKTHDGATGRDRVVGVIPALEGYLFQVQHEGSVNPADIASGFDLVATGGDAVTGRSKFELVDAGAATTGQCTLHGFVDRPDNVSGVSGTDVAALDCVVSFQETVWNDGGVAA